MLDRQAPNVKVVAYRRDYIVLVQADQLAFDRTGVLEILEEWLTTKLP